jgi:GNAT superfamily N-acetyltransferase
MGTATSGLLVPVAPKLIIRPASADDEGLIIGLVEGASTWLRGKATDQWARPWPDRETRDERIRNGIRLGHTWIVWDGETPAATVTIDPCPDVGIWPPSENVPAVYLHRLVVSRAYAGINLGGVLIDWAAQREARSREVAWVRVDVWRTNTGLHAYYERRGFTRSGTCTDPEYPAGALFQKDVRESLRTNTSVLEEVPEAVLESPEVITLSRRRPPFASVAPTV